MITKTGETSFRTEIAQYQEELDLSVINDQAKTKGNRTIKFNETEYNKIKELIPSFSSKYENVLAIEEDKFVYKGTDETLYRMALDIGLIPEDELLDDEILEELQPFITEWTVEAGDTITLPIGATCDFTVNYGDGTEDLMVTSNTDEDRIHTYTSAGTYTVTIKGKCKQFDFYSCDNTSKNKISRIIQWGNTDRTRICFCYCDNLTGSIPISSKNSFNKIENFKWLFWDCKKLEGNIPKNLFFNCPNVTSFDGTFYGCLSLNGSIPEDLFKKCPNVTTFANTFYDCKNLTGNIPENLFINNINISNFKTTFCGCSKLNGNAPALWERTNVTNSQWCFYDCTNLSNYNDIPSTWK